MSQNKTLYVAVCLVIGLVWGCTCPFSSNANGSVNSDESIFDGKTLKGWSVKNGTATYRVENGEIIGKTTAGSPNTFLCTDKLYANFEMTFEVKLLNDELNSGVQIRSNMKEIKNKKTGKMTERLNGPQIEIEANGTKGAKGSESGYIYGEACGGWMTPKDKLKEHTVFKNGEWNSYRIVAQGARIQTWVNGKQISDLTDEEKFKTHPKGFIGLQVHGVGNRGPYEVSWRNITLKELDTK